MQTKQRAFAHDIVHDDSRHTVKINRLRYLVHYWLICVAGLFVILSVHSMIGDSSFIDHLFATSVVSVIFGFLAALVIFLASFFQALQFAQIDETGISVQYTRKRKSIPWAEVNSLMVSTKIVAFFVDKPVFEDAKSVIICHRDQEAMETLVMRFYTPKETTDSSPPTL